MQDQGNNLFYINYDLMKNKKNDIENVPAVWGR